MSFVKILFFISLICVLLAEKILRAGTCVSKIVNGKFVQVGDCEKNDGSEIAELIRKNLDAKKKAQKKCDVTYDSKCYRVVVYNMKNVTFNDAKSICKPINNGEPANIYDSSHFQLMHAFQRTQIIPPRTRMSVWTGMKYSNGKIRLSSGKTSSLPFKLWYPGNPSSKRSFTNIGVNVNEDPYFNQGMFNNPPFYKLHGVMCEM